MSRVIRDTIVAVAGGAIFYLVVSYATSLTPLEIGGATLGVCVLLLAALEIPRRIRHRRAAYRAKLIAEVKAAVLAEIPTEAPKTKQIMSAAAILRTAAAQAKAERIKNLRELIENGYALQARLRRSSDRATYIPNDLAADIARWGAQSRAALAYMPDYLEQFRNLRGLDEFRGRTGNEHNRMGRELQVLESAVESLMESEPSEPEREDSPADSAKRAKDNELRTLRDLVMDGRVIRADLTTQPQDRAISPASASEIAKWEARASTALAPKADFFDRFREIPPLDAFEAIRGDGYDRMTKQIIVIEDALRDAETPKQENGSKEEST